MPGARANQRQSGTPGSVLPHRHTHTRVSLPTPTLTRPLRLGRPPTEEATELTELMEELLGLWVSAETPMAIRLVFLALAGLVDGKPMRITLWMGAKSPNLGGHWKYLGRQEKLMLSSWSKSLELCLPSLPFQSPAERFTLGAHHS